MPIDIHLDVGGAQTIPLCDTSLFPRFDQLLLGETMLQIMF